MESVNNQPSVVYLLPDTMGGTMNVIANLLEYRAADAFAYHVVLTHNHLSRDMRATPALRCDSETTVEYTLPIENLHAALPARTERECEVICRDMFAHFGRLLVVLLKFSTLRPDQMLERVEFEGEERVVHAHAQNRGVLLYTGHFGFWEINALVHALMLAPMAVLARPLDNPLLHDLLERVRTRTGNSVFYRRGAIRRVLRALEANQAVAFLIDQHMQPADAVYVEFFNRPAATTSALAALALRTGAPVVPVFALPLPGGRFRMVYEHPVEPPNADDEHAITDAEVGRIGQAESRVLASRHRHG